MSDEEKKAIDKLKRSANYFVMPIYETKIILELIEKQYKEIEELKEENKKKSIVIIEYQDLYEKLQDKIKTKIEELEKEEKEALKGTKGQDRYAIKQEYMHKRSGLQSLLEKE